MALMTRFFQIDANPERSVFTFLVTKSVSKEGSKGVSSKDFWFGFHRWSMLFTNANKNLGITLIWRSPTEGTQVGVEASFTLMSRDHFTYNKSWSLPKDFHFTSTRTKIGNTGFASVTDLLKHRPRFVDNNGEFIVELLMKNCVTTFRHDFKFGEQSTNQHQLQPAQTNENEIDSEKRSKSFEFGPFRWNLVAKPHPLPLRADSGGTGSSGCEEPSSCGLGRTNSWAETAKVALAASRRRNTLKGLRRSRGTSEADVEEDPDLDSMGLSVSLARLSSKEQNNHQDEIFAKVAFKIHAGEKDCENRSDTLEDILCPGQFTRPWKSERRLESLWANSGTLFKYAITYEAKFAAFSSLAKIITVTVILAEGNFHILVVVLLF